MSALDIISALKIIIDLGFNIKDRFDSLNQATEEISLLNTNLRLLCKLFEDGGNDDIITIHRSEILSILDIVQSIARSYTNCARALGIEIHGTNTAPTKQEAFAKKYVKRVWTLYRIPDLLNEIRREAGQLERIYSALSAILLLEIRTQQQRSIEKETFECIPVAKKGAIYDPLPEVDFSTKFANIDLIVGKLMTECELLRQRLQEATISPDTSIVEDYQAQNPEGASFWRDRFQKGELGASTLRYEVRNSRCSSLGLAFLYPNIAASQGTNMLFSDRHYTFLGLALYMRWKRPLSSQRYQLGLLIPEIMILCVSKDLAIASIKVACVVFPPSDLSGFQLSDPLLTRCTRATSSLRTFSTSFMIPPCLIHSEE
jgi:hypothetical protein